MTVPNWLDLPRVPIIVERLDADESLMAQAVDDRFRPEFRCSHSALGHTASVESGHPRRLNVGYSFECPVSARGGESAFGAKRSRTSAEALLYLK
jgi:hypothetical protein